MRIRGGIKNFEEIGVIDFEKDDIIKERVLRNDFSKVYTLKDISKWVEYGLKNGLIKKGGEKKDVEMMVVSPLQQNSKKAH